MRVAAEQKKTTTMLVTSCRVTNIELLNNNVYAGFEDFTAVTMNNAVLWDVAPCGFIIN
jgi:hypothetical protein